MGRWQHTANCNSNIRMGLCRRMRSRLIFTQGYDLFLTLVARTFLSSLLMRYLGAVTTFENLLLQIVWVRWDSSSSNVFSFISHEIIGAMCVLELRPITQHQNDCSRFEIFWIQFIQANSSQRGKLHATLPLVKTSALHATAFTKSLWISVELTTVMVKCD